MIKSAKEHISKKSVIKILFSTFIFNSFIAGFLTAIKYGDSFLINFIVSQSIGLSICTCVMIAHRFFDKASPVFKAALVATALIVGSIGGSYIGSFIAGLSPSMLFERHSLLQLLFLGVMFGSIITYFFSSREQIAESQAQIQEEKIKRLTSEKKAAEANLMKLADSLDDEILMTLRDMKMILEDISKKLGKR